MPSKLALIWLTPDGKMDFGNPSMTRYLNEDKVLAKIAHSVSGALATSFHNMGSYY
jgi:hypothetical protein